MTMGDIMIRSENGHYVGYVDGEMYCTGDTYLEVLQEMIDDGQVE